MVKPFTAKPFTLKPFLAMAASAFLAVGATAVLADEKNFLEIEPVSIDELSAEKGEGLDGRFQAVAGDPLRRRRPIVSNPVGGGQSTITLHSGQTRQLNSSSLSALNDLANISNIARNAGLGGNGG